MSDEVWPKFGVSKNIRMVSRIDIAGGGQVVVQDGTAFVGHMDAPHGTSILDVNDPKHPRVIAHVEIADGLHSHKVQVSGDVMVVNYERMKPNSKADAGLKIFDVSNREKPRQIGFYKTAGGSHRFTFDGRYVYFSPDLEGYLGNIVMILDLQDPSRPREVGRWWMPGQWSAGGETPTWRGLDHRCHHPIRKGDRLYVSYWYGGMLILDISDMSRPKLVSHLDWSPPYPAPTHTTLPIPWKLNDRDFLVVTDEEIRGKMAPKPAAFLWMVDITDESRPIPVSTFMIPHEKESETYLQYGAHQPAEQLYDNILYVTWFAGGLRAVDISNPYMPKEVGFYVPSPGKGQTTVKSNDVFRSKDGLLFLIDRLNGLEILESDL
jgi:hypothetical protein